MRDVFVLVTCEHGGNTVPTRWQRLFSGADDVLRSHRGWDPGALGVAQQLADRRSAPIIFSTTTRLLIELNRSIDHPGLFSDYTKNLSQAERGLLVKKYYAPYREAVEQLVGAMIAASRRVLHVSVHSFTDILDGDIREVDIGLLFDPARAWEVELCNAWRSAIESNTDGTLRIRNNQPYAGIDDGLTTYLRARFGHNKKQVNHSEESGTYAGIEIEIRQGLIEKAEEQRRFGDLLAHTIPL